MNEIVQDYEKQGLIEKCQSNFNSPAILVHKKDEFGTKNAYRLVIDYRKLNSITEIENFPMPLIEDILNSLNGIKYFTTLDIKGAFHQIELEEDSKNYTAFTAGNFQYRWIRMPMGLATAPLTWQRTINTILAIEEIENILAFMDDLLAKAKTRQEHDNILFKLMGILKKYNLQLNISKCLFYAKQFEFLGHIISQEGMRANPNKIKVIKQYPRPANVRDIQSFIGLCSYFRRYVNGFSKISKPLTSLLKKEQPFIWTHQQQDAFEKLKNILAEQVLLKFPNFDELFYVTTDASNMAIGGMLSQGELPNDRPVAFFSKTLNDIQKRYSTIEKELLAIVETIKFFRVYLYGRFFVLITDHKTLCYLFNMKDCGSRLFRQRLELSEYNWYRPGAQNKVADALSRIEPMSIEEILTEEKSNCFAITRAKALQDLNLQQKPHFTVEEQKKSYDLIFHLIPNENETLKNKLMNKLGVIAFSPSWSIFKKFHFIRTISNQFSHNQNLSDTQNCIKDILKYSLQNNAKNIAIKHRL